MDSPTSDPQLVAAMKATLPSPATKMTSFLSRPSVKEQMAMLDAESDDEEEVQRVAAKMLESTRPKAAPLATTSSELSTLASDFSNQNEGDETVPTSPMVSEGQAESQSPVVKSTARSNKRRRVVAGSSDEEDHLPDAADLTVQKKPSPSPEKEKKKIKKAKKSKSRTSSGESIRAAESNQFGEKAWEVAEVDSDEDMLSKKSKKSKKTKMKSLTKAELAETNATTAELKRHSTTRIEPGAKKMWKLSEVTDKFKTNNPPTQISQKAPRPSSSKVVEVSSTPAPPSTALEKHAEHAADDDETQNPHVWLESQTQSQTCHVTRKPSSPIEDTTSPAMRNLELDEDFDDSLPDANMVSKKIHAAKAAKTAAAARLQSDSDSDIEIVHAKPSSIIAKPARPDPRADLLNWTKGKRASSVRASVPPSSAMTETQFVKAGTTFGVPAKRSKSALPFSGSTTATIKRPTVPTNGSANLNASLLEKGRKQGAADRAKRQADFEARGGVHRKVIEAAVPSAGDAKEAITRLATEAKVVEEEEEDDDDYDPTTVEDLEMQYSGSDQEKEAGSGSEEEGSDDEEKTEPAQSPVKDVDPDTSTDFESFTTRKTLAGLAEEESTFIESAPKMPEMAERPLGHYVAGAEDQQISGFSQGFSQMFDDAPPATFAGNVFAPQATQAISRGDEYPVHDVPEHFRDQMVDKANEKAFNDAVDKPVEVIPELFVNDKGLLTQHRTEDMIYSQIATQDPLARGPDSPPRTVPGFSDSEDSDTEAQQQAQSPVDSSSGSRRPLQQVVDSGSEEEDEAAPAQIVKVTKPAPIEASTSTLSQTLPADAFAMMAQAQAAAGVKKSAKAKGKRSAFVNDQAYESEEDERYGGFMGGSSRNQEDDKDDGSDLDQNLEELVDDQKVDAEMQHEQDLLAGERYQEQVAEDDAQLQKRVQKDASGAWRSKRAQDGMLSDGDYSDDDYGRTNARQGKAKKRKIDGDQMDAIANNEETQAFAREYHTSHNPEDKDVGFLHEATQAEADESDEDDAPVKMTTREREEHIRALIENTKAGKAAPIPAGPSSDRSPESQLRVKDRTQSRANPRAANAWTKDDHFDDIDATYKLYAPQDTLYNRQLRAKEASEASQSRGSMGKSGGAKSSVTSYATKATKRPATGKTMSAPAVFPSKVKGSSKASSFPKSKGLATSRSASFAK